VPNRLEGNFAEGGRQESLYWNQDTCLDTTYKCVVLSSVGKEGDFKGTWEVKFSIKCNEIWGSHSCEYSWMSSSILRLIGTNPSDYHAPSLFSLQVPAKCTLPVYRIAGRHTTEVHLLPGIWSSSPPGIWNLVTSPNTPY